MKSINSTAQTYSYPRWYWSFAYLFCLLPMMMILLVITNYLFHPIVSITNQVLVPLGFFGLFLAYTLWAANRYRVFYSRVSISDLGLMAPVVESERPFSRIRKVELSRWEDIKEMRVFAAGNFDAVRMGRRSPGVRLYVPRGYIVILDCLPGFETLIDDVTSHMADVKAAR